MTMYCLLGSIVTVGLCYIYLHCPFHAISTEGGDIAIGTSTGDIYLFAVYDEGHSYRLVASVKVVYKVILEFGSLYLNIKSIEKIKNCVSSDTLQSIKRQKIDRKVIQKTDRKEIERSLKELSPYKYRGFVGGDMIFHVISSVTVTTESKTCDQNVEPAKPFQSTPFLEKRKRARDKIQIESK